MWRVIFAALAAICTAQSASAVSVASAVVHVDAEWMLSSPDAYISTDGESMGGTLVGYGPNWVSIHDDNFTSDDQKLSLDVEATAAADSRSAAGAYAQARAQAVLRNSAYAIETLYLKVSYSIQAGVYTLGRPTDFGEALLDFTLLVLHATPDRFGVLRDITVNRRLTAADDELLVSDTYSYILNIGTPYPGASSSPWASKFYVDSVMLKATAKVQSLAAVLAPVPVPPALPLSACGLGLLAVLRRGARSGRLQHA